MQFSTLTSTVALFIISGQLASSLPIASSLTATSTIDSSTVSAATSDVAASGQYQEQSIVPSAIPFDAYNNATNSTSGDSTDGVQDKGIWKKIWKIGSGLFGGASALVGGYNAVQNTDSE